MFGGAIGAGAVILFLRMARMDGENPFLWGFLAAAAWFLPMFLLGTVAPYVCIGVLFGIYFGWKMAKPEKGGQVR